MVGRLSGVGAGGDRFTISLMATIAAAKCEKCRHRHRAVMPPHMRRGTLNQVGPGLARRRRRDGCDQARHPSLGPEAQPGREVTMRHHHLTLLLFLSAMAAATATLLGGGRAGEPEFSTDFGLDRTSVLLPRGGNPYMSLRQGRFIRLEGEDDGEPVIVEITVLDRTRDVRVPVAGGRMSVRTRIVEEREWIDGELTQVAEGYFARCTRTGNIYCFGEHIEELEDGQVVESDDSWLAGREGAAPGLAMPAFFILGSRYYQQFAPGIAMDRAEHIASGQTIGTPAGVFENCILVRETSPLEPDEEVLKAYAPGVGLIMDGNLVLTGYEE
jgi:hypothetical protein